MEKVIETRREVIDFLQVDEYPDYGYGYGSGSGNSNGCGYGSGYGVGNRYGDSIDYGYGDGSGEGYGSSSGRGGSGGNIKNIKAINGMVVHSIDNIPTLIDSVHGNFAKGRIPAEDLTTKPCYIAKCGNYFAHGSTLEDAFFDAREKYEENIPLEERIVKFNNQYPDRNKKVPAKELFNWHHILTGSCLMGRKHFCEERKIDYENGEYSVNEFIQLTKNAYGGDVIRQLEESKPKL